MTTMPSVEALSSARATLSAAEAGAPAALAFDFNEACTVLIGWRRQEAVLRMLTATRAVIGGVAGLRAGDCLRLALHRGTTIVRECRVVGTSLHGVELEHFDAGMLAASG